MAFKDGTKSGGRQKGTPNRTTSARYAAMARVNEALAAIGEDPLSGMKLLKEVLNHKETPLDVKIQCAGLLIKQEAPNTEQAPYFFITDKELSEIQLPDGNKRFVVRMPAPVKDLDEWRDKYAPMFRTAPAAESQPEQNADEAKQDEDNQ